MVHLIFLALFGLGCSNPFPRDCITQKLNLGALLPPNGRTPQEFSPLESVRTAPEYQVCDCLAVLNVSAEERDAFMSEVLSRAEKEVIRLGGRITGNGTGGNSARKEAHLSYQTGHTVGELRLYTTTADGSKLYAIIVQYECRKRSFGS